MRQDLPGRRRLALDVIAGAAPVIASAWALSLGGVAAARIAGVAGPVSVAVGGLVAGLAARDPRVAVWAAMGASTAAALLLGWAAPSPAGWFAAVPLMALMASVGGVCALVGSGVRRSGMERATAGVLIAALAASMWMTALSLNAQRRGSMAPINDWFSTEPAAGSYSFDGSVYLKTFYLMHRGHDYYSAFREAVEGDTRATSVSLGSVLNFRMPTVFLGWALLPSDGRSIVLAYLGLASAGLVASFLLARAFVRDSLALVAPILLWPYMLHGAVTGWVLFAEYWALPLALASLAALAWAYRLEDRRVLAAAVCLAVLAAATRELFAYTLVCGLAAAVADRERKLPPWPFVAGIGVVIVAFAAHAALAASVVGGAALVSAGTWLHGGPAFLVSAIRFGQGLTPDSRWTPLVLAALGAIGAMRARPRSLRVAMSVAVLLPLGSLLIVGSGPAGDYWGLAAVPAALCLVPAGLGAAPWHADDAADLGSEKE